MAGERVATFDELIAEGTLLVSDGYRAKNSELGGSGLIFLRAGHVTDTEINFGGVDRFHAELSSKVASKLSRPGDTIITTKGNSTGRTAFVGQEMPTFVYSPHLSFWRSLDHDKIEPGFLRAWSRGQEFQTQLRAMSTSTDMAPYLSLVDQKRLRITLPSIHDQRSIARILGALDDKIELNRKTNETLEAMARALFKSWFVDFDPVRAKAEGRAPSGMDAETAKLFPSELVESELGPIPKGWRVGSVGDLVTLKRGTTYKGALVGQPGPALLGLGSIKPGGGFRKNGFKTYGGECPPDLMLRPGDMYVSLKGATKDGEMIGSVARVPRSVPSGRLTQDTVRLELRESFFATWLYRLLVTPEYRAYCAGRAMGSAVVALSRDDFLGYPAVLPSAFVLERFNAIIQPLEQRTEQNDAESDTLAELRDALLPRLLSGELPVVSGAEEAATW